jgi:flagellar basal-body rod protein FlgG
MVMIALQAAVTGTQASQTKIDTIANNIANINTTGFKKSEVQTSDLFYINLKRAGVIENSEASVRPVGVQIGTGSKILGTFRNLAEGSIRQTSQPLDIAITGHGYIAVTLPNGRIGYTRDGALKRDPNTGLITTSDGKPLTNNIAIPADILTDSVSISTSGLVTATEANNPSVIREIGQLEIFTFPNDQGLLAMGDNLLEETVASGNPVIIDDTNNKFRQGWLENSNVQAVEELTELITAQRAYELNSRVIRVVDEVAKDINSIK